MLSALKGSLTLACLSFIPLFSFASQGVIALPAVSSDPSSLLVSIPSASYTSLVIASSTLASAQSISTSASSPLPSSSYIVTSTIPFIPVEASSISLSPNAPGIPSTSTSADNAAPTSSMESDLETLRSRRIPLIIQGITGVSNIPFWMSSLGSDGKWPDSQVDYSTGCDAQRANWPAATHWYHISTMAAAFHGGVPNGDQWVNNTELKSSISSAMDYWFQNDFTEYDCLYNGGKKNCPCGTPGLWNTNWFSNVILIPNLVAETCLLLSSPLSVLTPTQQSNCTHITTRAYGTFTSGQGFVSGANILDIAKIGVDEGLRTGNATLVQNAFAKIHAEVQVHDEVSSDGIRRDGSFGQHIGLLYNGNYGKDYTNDDLGIELEAAGTQLAATNASREALETLIDGDRWMIYRNILTGVLHWDFSTLPRFISFPVADGQATASINLNLTEILELGETWNSSVLRDAYYSLSENTTDANAGKLYGNRMFYNNDYMVHRGPGYVTTLKMFSDRTKTTECTNSQNPFGFHLSDGTLYTYLRGDEYEDIAAAWDWNLIPGTTVDYGGTELDCDDAGYTGVEDFVGGASTGTVGVAAMRYTNPDTGDLTWQKAWFFLEDDVQHVMVNSIQSASDAPVYSVLDQRKHVGQVWVNGLPIPEDGGNFTQARSIWHGNVGYTFDEGSKGVHLSVQSGNKTGDWSAIGTSKQPPETVDLFAAWVEHAPEDASLSYTVYPGASLGPFQYKSLVSGLQTIQNDGDVSAVYDTTHQTALFVFWSPSGGSAEFTPFLGTPMTVAADGNSIVVYDLRTGNITASDPSQSLSNLHVSVSAGRAGVPPSGWRWGEGREVTFELPLGGRAGSSTTRTI